MLYYIVLHCIVLLHCAGTQKGGDTLSGARKSLLLKLSYSLKGIFLKNSTLRQTLNVWAGMGYGSFDSEGPKKPLKLTWGGVKTIVLVTLCNFEVVISLITLLTMTMMMMMVMKSIMV